jgi:transposase
MAMKYTEEQLNTVDKSLIIQMFLAEQEQTEKLTKQVEELNVKLSEMDEKMQHLLEQVILSNKARFGRSSEKMEDSNQLCFKEVDGNIVFFNEAEATADPNEPEPDTLETAHRRGKKKVGKKEQDLKGLPVNRIDHYMSVEELTAEFGANGWKQLPDAISVRYTFTPAKIEVEEHHVGVYSDKKDDSHILKAKHPKTLLRGSLVSPSLGAALMNAKYVNATPLARMEREMERYGLSISRKNMANWMIRLGEDYIGILYDYLHELLYDYHVIQADETPVLVNRDGRPAGSKSYMWVYRSGFMQKERQIVLYEFQKTRNASHPREFLKDFKGVCVTDGYQVYHTLEDELQDLTIAGCWVHCRRRFSDAQEIISEKARRGTLSYLVMKQIQAIYREEGKLEGNTAEERLAQRQVVIKPLVDALFVYLKQHEHEVPKSGKLRDAFTYALNQEKYLRVFLSDGDVPIDNNASERAIRGFCIGKKNWEVIDTINGAKTSAMIYSIAETAKANNLKPFEYFQYILEEIPEHTEDTNRDFLKDLLPWSANLPEHIRKPQK